MDKLCNNEVLVVPLELPASVVVVVVVVAAAAAAAVVQVVALVVVAKVAWTYGRNE